MSLDLTKFHNQFREETTENVRVLGDGLLALEALPDTAHPDAKAHVDAMFRAVHTIKGSSRLLGFADIGRLAHKMEDVLGAVRAGQLALNRGLIDQLLKGGDALLDLTVSSIDGTTPTVDSEALIGRLEQQTGGAASPPAATEVPPPVPPAEAAPPAPPAAPAEDKQGDGVVSVPSSTPAVRTRTLGRDTVRVRVDRLDRLINLTGELVIGQQTLVLHNQVLRELNNLNQQQERVLVALDHSLRQQRLTHEARTLLEQDINVLLNTCDQMQQLLRGHTEQFAQYVGEHRALMEDLEQEVITTRLLPISMLFGALPRAVRELANATGKDVLLETYGETTELDRKLLESLNDPLLHLVRNAIDHGIELPAEREAAGKPSQGRLSVVAEATGGEVRVTIRDDGRGIDPQRIRETAVRKNLINADSAAMLSDQEALDLIFLPGFSTAPILTDVSGRGVGMDVVRTNIDELSGQVMLESQLGQGTQITLLLPLTLVTTRVLLVQPGHTTFALPASGCRGIIWIHQDAVQTIEGRATIVHQEQTVPVLRLADLLGVESDAAFTQADRMPAVLLGNDRRLLGLLVDKVIDEREAVIKPVGPLVELQRRYTGAVQLGDGTLVLLLNPMTLVQMARGVGLARSNASGEEARKEQSLLIADDSFTTRELMRSILSSAGYTVTAAVDGADAFDKLQTQTYDLVVSDVEMPRMNGFELTRSIRQELGNEDLPVIIVTSLASDEHRRQGMEAGAQAYIVKSQFNQDNLLEAIQQLLGQ